jgi:hypothetical protein
MHARTHLTTPFSNAHSARCTLAHTPSAAPLLAPLLLHGCLVPADVFLWGDPCVSCTGDFFAVGGSDKQVALHTRTGVRLATVCEVDGWVWACAARPKEKEPYIAVGCSDGTIALHELRFPTVHGLYKNRYIQQPCILMIEPPRALSIALPIQPQCATTCFCVDDMQLIMFLTLHTTASQLLCAHMASLLPTAAFHLLCMLRVRSFVHT